MKSYSIDSQPLLHKTSPPPHSFRHLFLRLSLVVALFWAGALPAWSVGLRWASSSNRIYVTGPGSATLSDIVAVLDHAPLTQVAPGVWHLGANILLQDGAQLLLHGTSIGGDVDELRLRSNNSLDANSIVWISADWGAIDIQSTRITSWDEAAGGPDTETDTYGRAYIRVRSSLASDGVTAQESRMDIIDSDVGYLGYYAAEAYGLSWKVNGAQPNLYDLVNVYGNVQGSRIHDNYFGIYTFGGYGMQIRNNEVDHNVRYGIDPHDDSDDLLIEENWAHHNGDHGIIASQRCDHVVIRNNTSEYNAGCGIMLHRSSDDGTVTGNLCQNNADCGIALFDVRNTLVQGNRCLNNGRSGMRLSVGSADNQVDGNEFANNQQYGIYLYQGSDVPHEGDDGRPKRNLFTGNSVTGNLQSGINLTNGDDNRFSGNEFANNAPTLRFSQGPRNILDGNTIPGDVTAVTEGSPTLPGLTIIRRHPLIQVQIDDYSTVRFEDELGAIYEPAQGGVSATVTPTGSVLSLTTANMGTLSTVVQRKLWVLPDTGSATVSLDYWRLTGDLGKKWTIQSDSRRQTLLQVVGDLAPNTAYQVSKQNKVLLKITSDAQGSITFADRPGDKHAVHYTVAPVVAPPPGKKPK
jgi:poly(beta-D-mannuronate) C5 epimerase